MKKNMRVITSIMVAVLFGYIFQCFFMAIGMLFGKFFMPQFFIPNAGIIIIFSLFIWWFISLKLQVQSKDKWCNITLEIIIILGAFTITTMVPSLFIGFHLWDSYLFWISIVAVTAVVSIFAYTYIRCKNGLV